MRRPTHILERGTRIRTHETLGSAKGMWWMPPGGRKPDTPGTIVCASHGCGGDVYIVAHDDGSRAPYSFDEFELVTE